MRVSMCLCASSFDVWRVQKSVCDLLCDLISFVQFEKCDMHPYGSGYLGNKKTLPDKCLTCFLNSPNDTKPQHVPIHKHVEWL